MSSSRGWSTIPPLPMSFSSTRKWETATRAVRRKLARGCSTAWTTPPPREHPPNPCVPLALSGLIAQLSTQPLPLVPLSSRTPAEDLRETLRRISLFYEKIGVQPPVLVVVMAKQLGSTGDAEKLIRLPRAESRGDRASSSHDAAPSDDASGASSSFGTSSSNMGNWAVGVTRFYYKPFTIDSAQKIVETAQAARIAQDDLTTLAAVSRRHSGSVDMSNQNRVGARRLSNGCLVMHSALEQVKRASRSSFLSGSIDTVVSQTTITFAENV